MGRGRGASASKAKGGGGATSVPSGSGGPLAPRLNFVQPPGTGRTTVLVDVAKLDASLAEDPGFHVGPGGTGKSSIAGRYEGAREFLAGAAASGIPVHMTRVYVDKSGSASIADGRHRFAALRDSGATAIPVSVYRNNAARVRRLFGA
jgi:hypothetical protein